MAYNVKVVDYDDNEKLFLYHFPIQTGKNTSAKVRKKYEDFSDDKKAKSDKRRIAYYKKKVSDVIDIAMMNKDLDSVITLTFLEGGNRLCGGYYGMGIVS